MLRLVAYAPDGVRRFPVHRSHLLIGSQPECDIYLPYTGVAQRHAAIRYDGEELSIEDLGSRRGVVVSGRRVRRSPLEVLDEIRLGGVTLLVEDVAPEPEEPPPPPPPAPAPLPTPTPEAMLDHLSRVSEWVLTDVESRTTSEELVSEVLSGFGGGTLLLLQGEPGEIPRAGLKLAVATDPGWLAHGEELVEQTRERLVDGTLPATGLAFDGLLGEQEVWIAAHAFDAVGRAYVMITALPCFASEGWSPLSALKALGELLILGLVHHVGWYEPILPGHGGQRDLVLAPELVLGPSEAMKAVLEQLKGAVDPPVHILLRGEPGVGKELLARSLHLSGPRRHGPFVAAGCDGASATQIEADLFGAEISGREGPVRREGKIFLAAGGTLYLDDIDRLPLELQARLVRFLRSGEVEPAGSRAAYRVDVRLVAGSRGPLEPAVAHDQFRVDLAYRLSRFAIDVPPLRQRREDLPLIIQSYINRFCHETGKRMQGITVKAMSALLAYDYPGNLAELENIVRQLVYLCPSGQPMDVNLLPDKVRLSRVRETARVDATSELDLDRLVGETERVAIREALRRTRGNKSQAARLLGLSRNGLAMKMERYGLKG